MTAAAPLPPAASDLAAPAESPRRAGPRKKARLLVVDDNQEHLALVVRWLESEGFDVISADSGERALVAFETRRPE